MSYKRFSFNTDVFILRAVFTLILVGTGYFLRPIPNSRFYSMLAAGALAAVILFFETRVRRASLKSLIGAAIGSILGIVGATLIGILLSQQPAMGQGARTFATIAILIFMAYVGLMVGAAKGEFLDLSALGGILMDRGQKQNYKILDTSVIIDGRIADIAETKFLEGVLIVPQFVLRELQQIADSADASKRNRGRRGLDVLRRLQNNPQITVQISEASFPNVREVDLKLIELAKQLNARIITNDFNLNKVSELRGVEVLNINELANALKPVVLPGEIMKVFILKEGKEHNQGVAYLDDGTMVVVDNARRMIGKTVAASVTSVLQTTAGKMIFGRYVEETRSGKIRPVDAEE
ncbi:MAG: PIN domain-containing protein [Acidobacteriota bacterium]|nr:PIN domain-containing protein [Blastocatellia bacterium]MDW8238638.1 PIN domain-containing protein [Acidobacteriota bacterium]